jgi:GT2 family glycosyltransferase
MIRIIVPTVLTEVSYKQSVPYKCLEKLIDYDDRDYSPHIIVIPENKEGFCLLYNRYINKYPDDTVVFIHDDIEIHDQYFFEKLQKAHEKYDIVGLAGASSQDYTTSKTFAWHLCMNKREDGRGFLSHAIPKDVGGYGFPYINSSYFGPTPADAVFVDGVFISFNTKKVVDSGVKFNEKYTFHHYDMSACAEAKKAGLSIGVYPIFGIHHGLGEFHNDKLWNKLAIEFGQDYKDYKFSV